MNQPNEFAEAKLSAPSARVQTVIQEVLRLVAPESPLRVLDACCGDGGHVLALAEALPKATLFGVDISAPNIAQAQASLARHPEAARIRFEQADYLLRPTGRYDLIISVGGVNFIPVAPETIFSRLDDELAPGGILLLVTPAANVYNKALLALRGLFRALRSPTLDALGMTLARWLHGRHYSNDQLRSGSFTSTRTGPCWTIAGRGFTSESC